MKSSDVPKVFANLPVPHYGLPEVVKGLPIQKKKSCSILSGGNHALRGRAFSTDFIDYGIIDSQDERHLLMTHIPVKPWFERRKTLLEKTCFGVSQFDLEDLSPLIHTLLS